MAKKHVHSLWYKIEHFSPWYLLAVSLVGGMVCVLALRQNNLNMIKLRDKVFAADKADGDIEGALRDLRSYVYAHMNTNLSSDNSIKPPIQLKYRYERLLKAEQDRVKSDSGQTYTDAQRYCEKKFPEGFYGATRLPCIRDYLKKHTPKAVQERPIPDALYKFDFVSPLWSPDLAGWSMLVAIVSFVFFAFRLGLEKWVKHDLANA